MVNVRVAPLVSHRNMPMAAHDRYSDVFGVHGNNAVVNNNSNPLPSILAPPTLQ
jgi:hypothetical protein